MGDAPEALACLWLAGGFGGAPGAFGMPAQAAPAPAAGPFGATHAAPAFQGFGAPAGQPQAFGAPGQPPAPFTFGAGAAEGPGSAAGGFTLGEAAGDPQMAQRKRVRVKRPVRK